MAMSRIFISYRREDTAGFAGRLCDRLVDRFGRDQVFMDIDTLQPGEMFAEVIAETVSSCDALIALIGKGWLTATDAEGRRRLGNPDDWLRLEVSTALRRDIPVVPVLLDGASFPPQERLPDDLVDLAGRQATDVTHTRFHQDVDDLIEGLCSLLGLSFVTVDPSPLLGNRGKIWKEPYDSNGRVQSFLDSIWQRLNQTSTLFYLMKQVQLQL